MQSRSGIVFSNTRRPWEVVMDDIQSKAQGSIKASHLHSKLVRTLRPDSGERHRIPGIMGFTSPRD
jgi:hypothetical protein